MKFDLYEDANRPTFPSLKLGINDPLNPPSQETFSLDSDTFDPDLVYGGNVVMPGDILIEINKKAGAYGGVPLESLDAAIQSVSIDVPIPRQSIYGFGSNYVFDRKLKLPIIGSAAIEIDSFFTEGSVYDITIKHTDRFFNEGRVELASVVNTFLIEGAQLKQQAYRVGIGDSLTVGTFFTFGIGTSKGLKLF